MPSTNGHNGSTGKVALYMRVSGEEQARRESIGTQEAFLTDYCNLYGFEVAGVYKDVAISGTVPVPERPAGFEMLEEAKRGNIDTVLFYKLYRIGRKLVVVVDAHDRLEESPRQWGDGVARSPPRCGRRSRRDGLGTEGGPGVRSVNGWRGRCRCGTWCTTTARRPSA